MLTKRERKGFAFEKLIYQKLQRNNISAKWRPYQEGSDFKIGQIELEAKFSHAKIFRCWILRDWVTRFSKGCKIKLAVTNRGMKLTEKALEVLKEHKIRVVYFDRLILTLQAIFSALKHTTVTIIESILLILREKRSLESILVEEKTTESNQFLKKKRKKKEKVQENCQNCGQFLKIDESLLCRKCYSLLWKWINKNWRRITKNQRQDTDILDLWLKEVKKHD